MARGFAASKTKKEFLEKLGLQEGSSESEEIFRKMLDEATYGRQRLSQYPGNLVPGITETARHDEILQIYRSASPLTKPFYDRGYYLDGANEENWVVRWCLYHSFRYTDNRNRNRTRGHRPSQSSSPQSPRLQPGSSSQMAAEGLLYSSAMPAIRDNSSGSNASPSSLTSDEGASRLYHITRTNYYDPARDL